MFNFLKKKYVRRSDGKLWTKNALVDYIYEIIGDKSISVVIMATYGTLTKI